GGVVVPRFLASAAAQQAPDQEHRADDHGRATDAQPTENRLARWRRHLGNLQLARTRTTKLELFERQRAARLQFSGSAGRAESAESFARSRAPLSKSVQQQLALLSGKVFGFCLP